MKRIREDFSTILRSLAQAPTCVLYCNLQYILQVASLHKRSVRHQCSTTKTSKKLTKIVPRTVKIETKSAKIVPSCRIWRTSGQVGRRKRAESARDRPRAAQERPKSGQRAAQERPRGQSDGVGRCRMVVGGQSDGPPGGLCRSGTIELRQKIPRAEFSVFFCGLAIFWAQFDSPRAVERPQERPRGQSDGVRW